MRITITVVLFQIFMILYPLVYLIISNYTHCKHCIWITIFDLVLSLLV